MVVIKGIAASNGIAIAKAAWVQAAETGEARCTLDEAVHACLEELEQSRREAESAGNTQSVEILDAYETLLGDEVMLDEIRAEHESGTPLCAAVDSILSAYASMFEAMSNEYMRQRAEDVRNIASILRAHLTGAKSGGGLDELSGLLAARELTPLDTIRLDKSRICGFMTELGGATSHIAILAKSLGLPAAVGMTGLMEQLAAFEKPPLVVLDGGAGIAYLDPDEQTLSRYRALQAQWEEQKRLLAQEAQTEGRMAGGERVKICANIGGAEDVAAIHVNYDGVGLFRTEFLFSSLDHAPTFEEQYALYREVVEKNGDRYTTFRTLDVGGDKGIPYLGVPAEENPFLGNRGIRLCLDREEIFLEQLKAILAAGAGHKLKLMFPMVSEVGELRRAKDLVRQAQELLSAQQTPQCTELKLGVMVETPSAAMTADILLDECDFVSLGTNDLTQYVMAADRNNSAVAALCNACSPAVVRAIRYVAETGSRLGKEVSVCGELAGTPRFIPLLLGLGIRTLSVSPGLILAVRHQVRRTELGEAEKLAQAVLAEKSSSGVSRLLEKYESEHK